jgi:hypothetical protein
MRLVSLWAIGAISLVLSAASASNAVNVSWASFNSDDGDTLDSVYGTLETPGGGSVDITYSGGYVGDQLNNTGYNYWSGNFAQNGPDNFGPNYNGPVNQPSISDQIELSDPNTGTITFSSPVVGVYLALNSWNGAVVTFDQTFEIVSEGCGIFGCGTFQPNSNYTGFTGLNEAAGILYFPGSVSSITFTDTTPDYYHALTVGDYLSGPVPSAIVPEPSAWLLVIAGLGLVGASIRRITPVRVANRATS